MLTSFSVWQRFLHDPLSSFESTVNMSSATQRRKRSTAAPSSCPRRRAKTSVAAGCSSAGVSAALAPAAPTETIDVLDTTTRTSEGEEDVVDLVDLTCEGSEPAAVVDLTNNDSVVLVEEGQRRRRSTNGESYVVSSDEEDTNTVLNAALLSSLQASSKARATPGTISCPVCMDTYAEIIESGRLVVSTKCGHLFCSQCLRDSLARSHTCPTCRKKLTHKQYHPIYI